MDNAADLLKGFHAANPNSDGECEHGQPLSGLCSECGRLDEEAAKEQGLKWSVYPDGSIHLSQ